MAFVSIVYAAKVYEISFTNNFETGSVDVQIEQYEVLEDGSEKLIDPGVVMPNMDVSYIPRVTNLRSDSYVRVKVDIVMDKEIPQPITLDSVYNLNKDWVQRGDYFYYTKVMKTDETSDLFEGFHVPEEWLHETASGFTINLTVDAVQDDHFTPDFDSELPWGTIEIEQAKEEDNIVYGVAKQVGDSPSFEYTASKGLEASTTDLFSNFDHYMAGDVYSDTLTMKNKSDNDIVIYFRTQNERDDLLDQMDLKIDCAGETIYEGNLASEALFEYEELTVIKANSSEDFDFEVKLPEKSQNYYSVLKDKVVWQFKVVEIRDDATQTGDDWNRMFYTIILVLAAITAIFAFMTRRKETE